MNIFFNCVISRPMLLHLHSLFVCLYVYYLIIAFMPHLFLQVARGGVPGSPLSLFNPHNSLVRWVRLRDSDGPKIT